MIRRAKAIDIPRIAALIEEAHARSPAYAGIGKVDVNLAKRTLTQAIQRDGLMSEGGWCVRVAETHGKVEGFAAAYLTRVYDVGDGDHLVAQDYMIYGSKDCAAPDGVALILALEAWAEKNPRVLDHQPSVVDTVVEDWRRLGGFYERRGYVQVGAIYRKRFQR